MTIPMRRLMFCLFFVLIAIFPSGQAESTLANELVRVLKTIESKEYEKALIELEVLEPLLHDGSNSAMHSADYHFFRAVTYHKLGRYDEALRHFDVTFDLSPYDDQDDRLPHLASTYHSMGRFLESLKIATLPELGTRLENFVFYPLSNLVEKATTVDETVSTQDELEECRPVLRRILKLWPEQKRLKKLILEFSVNVLGKVDAEDLAIAEYLMENAIDDPSAMLLVEGAAALSLGSSGAALRKGLLQSPGYLKDMVDFADPSAARQLRLTRSEDDAHNRHVALFNTYLCESEPYESIRHGDKYIDDMFHLAGGFERHPNNTFYDTMFVCNFMPHLVDASLWRYMAGPLQHWHFTVNGFPSLFEATNQRSNHCQHMHTWFSPSDKKHRNSVFLPCYTLPDALDDFEAVARNNLDWMWMWKPDMLFDGYGITLLKSSTGLQLVNLIRAQTNFTSGYLQRYVHPPHLIHGTKYDLRVYAFVPSVEPLRVYVHEHGFARRCAVDYNLEALKPKDMFDMEVLSPHICHFRFGNKTMPTHRHNDDETMRMWGLDTVFGYITAERGAAAARVAWISMKDKLAFAVMGAAPKLRADKCAGCYAVIGADVVFDDSLTAHVLELNVAPSVGFEYYYQRPFAPYIDAWRARGIHPHVFPADTHLLQEYLADTDVTLTPSEMLSLGRMCAEFYYRGGYELAWPLPPSLRAQTFEDDPDTGVRAPFPIRASDRRVYHAFSHVIANHDLAQLFHPRNTHPWKEFE
eukprot:Rmarinus@m.24084